MTRPIVVDVGSASYGEDASIPALVEEFQPHALLGYDPSTTAGEYRLGDTLVRESQRAVWIFDGSVRFTRAGLGGHVESGDYGSQVACIDLAGLLEELAKFYPENPLVLKLDCEGAEYELVPHLVRREADRLLELALIEWHCADCLHGIIAVDSSHPPGCPHTPAERQAWTERRDRLEESLSCEVRRWGR